MNKYYITITDDPEEENDYIWLRESPPGYDFIPEEELEVIEINYKIFLFLKRILNFKLYTYANNKKIKCYRINQ